MPIGIGKGLDKIAATGTPGLDDLLYGGIDRGKQVLALGPPFIGKELMVNRFLLEGLKKRERALVLLTDCSPSDIRNEMGNLMDDYERYEKEGLVRYIDAYSLSKCSEERDPNALLVESPTDYTCLNKALEKITKGFKREKRPWRMAVRSVSSLLMLSEPTSTYKFLQQLTGRSKRDKVVGFYLMDKGMHNEIELAMVRHLMDGTVEFMTEDRKLFLAIDSIKDVKWRGLVGYQYTKRGLVVDTMNRCDSKFL